MATFRGLSVIGRASSRSSSEAYHSAASGQGHHKSSISSHGWKSSLDLVVSVKAGFSQSWYFSPEVTGV